MNNPEQVIALLLHEDPHHHQQGEELLCALPELSGVLFGADGLLWQREDGVVEGLVLLQHGSPTPQESLWLWGLASMARTGPFPWQPAHQHRQDLHDLRQWQAQESPPLSLRDICRRALWMVQRHRDALNDPSAALWARACHRHEELPSLLSSFEFIADTLEEEQDPAELHALEEERQRLGDHIRPILAELLVLVDVASWASKGRSKRIHSLRWHQRHLGPLLCERYDALHTNHGAL